MRFLAIMILSIVLAVSPSHAATNPVYTLKVHIDGIFGGSSDAKIQECIAMLKNADQKILDMKVLARNGYGKILAAAVEHTPAYPINAQVSEEAQKLRVTIDGIWGGNSYGRITQQVNTLKSAEQIILRIEVTAINGYGKILGANIHHISKYKYEALMGN